MFCLSDLNNNSLHSIYNDYKNNLRRAIRQAKVAYFKIRFSYVKNNAKRNWDTINLIFGRSKKKKSPEIISDGDGNDVSDPINISKLFCDYFTSVASVLDIRIPASHIDPMYYMADAIPNSFYASPATEDEVNLITKQRQEFLNF